MLKKGFTLIEILAVIVILSILATIIIPSVFTMLNRAKEDAYKILMDNFEQNTRLYINKHIDEVEENLDLYSYYTITLNDLKGENLLKTPVTDPRNDELIDLSKKVIITRESDKSLSICYEDRGCYIPTLLVNELTKLENIVSGNVEGLHRDTLNDFYYYRGANPKNWISFNNYLWRIVKINSDGSVKLIFEGKKTKSGTKENGSLITNTFDEENSNNFNNSLSIKTYLSNWYSSSISEENNKKVKLSNWCIGKIGFNETGTLKETFLNNECSVRTTSSSKVGLISGSEYLYASLDSSCLNAYKTSGDYGRNCKNDNYLYKSGYNYWSITRDNNDNNVWIINSLGSLGAPLSASTTSNIRPVINLSSGMLVDRGMGTFDNPYTIKDIVNVDKEKPVITLLGDNPVTVYQGKSYSDTGAIAIDNLDGDITSRIVTYTDLNINIPGTYTVTYVVSDNTGNRTIKDRTIVVKKISIATNGLLLWYDFRDKTNLIPDKTIIEDLSGNGNHGTLNNFVFDDNNGWTGSGLKFDGDNDYVSLTNPPIYTSSFTISMSIFLSEDSREILFGDYGIENGINVKFEKHSNGKLRLYWAGVPDVFSPEAVTQINKWCNVSLVVNKEESLVSFYVDGVLADSYSHTLTDKTTNTFAYIGRDNRTGITAFNGIIGDIQIYNRALTTLEINNNIQ